ncbi:MAG: hypothetical protein P4L56_15160 [Candidatus Sulfopaludibacter sp.]|nr:hypothetical protein [Candidatus Sulfopaludibacter sp.]
MFEIDAKPTGTEYIRIVWLPVLALIGPAARFFPHLPDNLSVFPAAAWSAVCVDAH